MKLLTKAIEKKLPALYATEHIDAVDKVAQVKFFAPEGSATWYGVEYDPAERMFFGYVTGLGFDEWGYFSLAELEQIRTPALHLPVERDMYFEPKAIYKVLNGRN